MGFKTKQKKKQGCLVTPQALTYQEIEVEVDFATDSQSASSSRCRATNFNFLCLTITFFLLHVERTL
jgi:hypothetical protein